MKAKNVPKNLFVCRLCDDIFTDEVWHCIGCAHHWTMDVMSCKNCYTPIEQRHTREHKRKRVLAFLKNKVLRQMTDRGIAEVAGVSAALVAKIRRTNDSFQCDKRMRFKGDAKKLSEQKDTILDDGGRVESRKGGDRDCDN